MAESSGQAVSFTASGDGEGQRATGIQCWPSARLAARLASNGSSATDSVLGLLTSAASDLPSLSLGGTGWSEVADWNSVKHVLGYVEKPWGHERLWALNQHYAGKILFIKAGESLSLQYHEIKDETIRIASGSMRLRAGPSADRLETHILDPGMSYEISTRVVHQMEAIEDCTVIEVSTPHLTDVVRLEDRYGRT
jgi:mannose-6-phosphate isomerase-like protein (cupin superfamily)